ncbi:MAG: hypothetical protein WAN76_20030, partial [Candidatus Sulfotelmatobacter sp.]
SSPQDRFIASNHSAPKRMSVGGYQALPDARSWVNNSLTFGDEVLGTASQSRHTLATQHYMLLQRNLIYTGITRGKRLLVLIGQKKALGIAVRNDRSQRRYSGFLASVRGDRRHSSAAPPHDSEF